MTTFMMKMHLKKDTQIFTMDADTHDSGDDDALLASYLAEHPVLREIGEEQTNKVWNNIYIVDNTLGSGEMDAEDTVAFLAPRRLYLVSEDDDACELLLWLPDVEPWWADAVNYAAYDGKFYERVDKTREMIDNMMFNHYDTDGDGRFHVEMRMLHSLEHRAADPARWLARRKAESRAELYLAEPGGRMLIFHSPEALEDGLENLLRAVMSRETETLAHDTNLVFSCNFSKTLKKPLQKSLRVFEGSDAKWRKWEKEAAAAEYTDEDFFKIMEGKRSEVEGEILFEKYFDEFRTLNENKRQRFSEALYDLYYGYLRQEGITHAPEYASYPLPDAEKLLSVPSLNQIRAMTLGFAVGDALGVPVEFFEREDLDKTPVTGMRAGSTWSQPEGTWSDDTSMTLATMESIARVGHIDYDDIMKNYVRWKDEAAFTATDKVFDVGGMTGVALERYKGGVPAEECGGTDEHDNGNGSLMRILPIAALICQPDELWINDIELVNETSALTHAHPRSQVACRIYSTIAIYLMLGAHRWLSSEPQRKTPHECIEYALEEAKADLCADADELNALCEKFAGEPPIVPFEDTEEMREGKETYARLWTFRADNLPPRDEIRSSGYVVDTLEAAVWCLLSTDNFRDAVLTAVNLGDDTDTVAAITGGLAGLAYGLDAIPKEWLATLKKRDYIEEICIKFHDAISK